MVILLIVQKKSRIDPRVIQIDAPMQVRTCDTTGLSDPAYLISGFNYGARCYIYGIHVAVKTNQSMPVVENYCIAIKKIVARLQYNTRCRGKD